MLSTNGPGMATSCDFPVLLLWQTSPRDLGILLRWAHRWPQDISSQCSGIFQPVRFGTWERTYLSSKSTTLFKEEKQGLKQNLFPPKSEAALSPLPVSIWPFLKNDLHFNFFFFLLISLLEAISNSKKNVSV